MIYSLKYSRTTSCFHFCRLYTCSICILIWLRLDYGQVSNKCHIFEVRQLLESGAYSYLNVIGVALIRGRRLFEAPRLLEEMRYTLPI